MTVRKTKIFLIPKNFGNAMRIGLPTYAGTWAIKPDAPYLKNMMSGDIWLHNGCLKISPSRHVKPEAWDAIDADDVILSLDNSPEEIGAGLKLALSRCRQDKPRTKRKIIRHARKPPEPADGQNKTGIKNRPKNPDGGSNRLPRLTGAAGSFDRIAVGIGKAEKGFAAFLVPLGSVSEQTVFGGIAFAGCGNVGREDGTPAVQPQRDFAAVQIADAHRQTVLA